MKINKRLLLSCIDYVENLEWDSPFSIEEIKLFVETLNNLEREEIVLVNKKEWEETNDAALRLEYLEIGGVDNWEWYGESLRKYHKEKYGE